MAVTLVPIMQVLLPENLSTEVSEEVFKRTPADVRATYLAARKMQEQGQVLTLDLPTQTWCHVPHVV